MTHQRKIFSKYCNCIFVFVRFILIKHLCCSQYAKGTWDYLNKLWNSPDGGKLGVSLLPCVKTSDTVEPVPSVSNFVYGFQTLSPEELAAYKKPEWK